ncbi:MAG TPA: hypothetical protein PK014_02370 [Thermoanaerobaculia bacterium]|nr:hypothetical protein [Thermoanaerobaculia bacterium]HUM28922.1 hypothetical protein [Thermoanaerobaculia bacterium]HXK67145.1 hypothetical protein [Thermoanaerobaculia bacterium]
MTTFLVDSDVMGRGNDELGSILIEKFFTSLSDADTLPESIYFYNTGVRLCTEDSPVACYLRILRERGVHLYACGTCLNHMDLTTIEEVEGGTMKALVDHLCSGQGIIKI